MRCFQNIVILVAALAAGDSFAKCPELSGDPLQRVRSQRAFLAGLQERPARLFLFADCAVAWSRDVRATPEDPEGLQTETWRLLQDIENILSRASATANDENEIHYRSAWKDLGRAVIASFKDGAFASIPIGDRKKFILYHAGNLQLLGSPGAQEYIEDVDGLGEDYFGPELVGAIVRAMDSCDIWNFKEGANRPTVAQREALCSSECIDYTKAVFTTLEQVKSINARAATRKYKAMMAECSSSKAEP